MTLNGKYTVWLNILSNKNYFLFFEYYYFIYLCVFYYYIESYKTLFLFTLNFLEIYFFLQISIFIKFLNKNLIWKMNFKDLKLKLKFFSIILKNKIRFKQLLNFIYFLIHNILWYKMKNYLDDFQKSFFLHLIYYYLLHYKKLI